MAYDHARDRNWVRFSNDQGCGEDFFAMYFGEFPETRKGERFEVLTAKAIGRCDPRALATRKSRRRNETSPFRKASRNNGNLRTISARASIRGTFGFSFIQNGISPQRAMTTPRSPSRGSIVHRDRSVGTTL